MEQAPTQETSTSHRPTVIETGGLAKRFGEIEAVRGVDLTVYAGETFGFLGPNGAGKSTTISMLCTLAKPTGGWARVAGHDVLGEPTQVRRCIGLVFQDTTLDGDLTAEENLRLHAELYGVPRQEVNVRLKRVMDMVELWDRRRSQVKTFSGGMKRRLEIARGLLHSPQVLFLDEPTVGLDPQTRSHIWGYLNELKRQEAITTFLTTHYMEEAEYCDRIAIIDHGQIVVTGTPQELKDSVGKDRVTLRTENDEQAKQALLERFELEAVSGSEGLTVHVAQAEEFIPKLVGGLGVAVRSVEMARPTLDDVFMTYTGRTIRDAEAGAGESMRAWMQMARRRR
ncbi:MAG TPA: ATP-binding cassette domain-containing protein [Chloroflexota bacterium]|nr:ATP-binding cassette domain-containing protein [Chloroflexota bacterium]